MTRYLLTFGMIGATIPALWLAFYSLMGLGWNDKGNLLSSIAAEDIFIVLCPPSLLLLGDPEEGSYLLPALTVLANALLYGVVGGVVWCGVSVSKLFFVLLIVLIGFGWTWLLQL